MNFKKSIYLHWLNRGGWKVEDKIVVFESDDWGSTRMPDRQTLETMKTWNSINVEVCPYSRYDSLESSRDIEMLCEVLRCYTDGYGNHPIFTLNYLTANPDFGTTKQNGFHAYAFEAIEETYNRYGDDPKYVLQRGFEERLIEPQFHGREHLNVQMWLELLRSNREVLRAAEYGLFLLSFKNVPSLPYPYLAAFYPYGDKYEADHGVIFTTGIQLFEKYFGRKPTSFVPPVYYGTQELEKHIGRSSIESIQGLAKRIYIQDRLTKKIRTPKINPFGKINLIRNSFFEPSTNESKDWISAVLLELDAAFRMGRAAVICSHRLNYVGRLSEDNRKNNLLKLKILLSTILQKWPDVKFMSSSQLATYLTHSL